MDYEDKYLHKKRLEITKEILIPCLKSQTNQNFEWGIISSSSDVEYLRRELDYPFIPIPAEEEIAFVRSRFFHIQTRHDDDDWMAPDYIEKIQQTYLENESLYDSFVIHFQPTKLSYSTRMEYAMTEFHNRRISMFASLCQSSSRLLGPNADPNSVETAERLMTDIDYKRVRDVKHGYLYLLTNKIIKFPIGYVKLLIHDHNILSDFKESDIALPKSLGVENANHQLDFDIEYTKLFNKYISIADRISATRLKNDGLQAKVLSLQTKVGSLQAKVESLQERLESRQAKVTLLQAKVSSLQESVRTLQDKIRVLRNSIVLLREKMVLLKSKIDPLREKVAELKNKISKQSIKIQQLEKRKLSFKHRFLKFLKPFSGR